MDTYKFLPFISSFLKEEGFKHNKRLFYYSHDYVNYILSFSSPSSMLYCQYCIMPLYMPFEAITYTYGDRMKTILKKSTKEKFPSSDAISQWVIDFKSEFINVAKPFFSIMCEQIKSGSRYESSLPIIEFEYERLLVYSLLFNNGIKKAEKALKRYKASFNKIGTKIFTPEWIKITESEFEFLTELADSTIDGRKKYFDSIIESNKKFF